MIRDRTCLERVGDQAICLVPESPHRLLVVNDGEGQCHPVHAGRYVAEGFQQPAQQAGIHVLVLVVAHTAPPPNKVEHILERRERIRHERHAVRRIKPENRDGPLGTDGKTMLAAETVGLVLHLNVRDVLSRQPDDVRHAVSSTFATPQAFGFIHDKLNSL